jgi:hypothetical protein
MPQQKFDDDQVGLARDALFSISQSRIAGYAACLDLSPVDLTEAQIAEVASMRVAITGYEARLKQILEGLDTR